MRPCRRLQRELVEQSVYRAPGREAQLTADGKNCRGHIERLQGPQTQKRFQQIAGARAQQYGAGLAQIEIVIIEPEQPMTGRFMHEKAPDIPAGG
jgi:hypothetical protein